jgi:hypothetical protein
VKADARAAKIEPYVRLLAIAVELSLRRSEISCCEKKRQPTCRCGIGWEILRTQNFKGAKRGICANAPSSAGNHVVLERNLKQPTKPERATSSALQRCRLAVGVGVFCLGIFDAANRNSLPLAAAAVDAEPLDQRSISGQINQLSW